MYSQKPNSIGLRITLSKYRANIDIKCEHER